MNEREYGLGELDRRIGNLVRFGTIVAVDTATATATVDIGDCVTDSLPWLTSHAGMDRVWSTPDVGEQVLVVSPGDPSQGVIIGSAFSTAHAANGSDSDTRRITFSDGTVVDFNRATSVLNANVNSSGNINLVCGASSMKLDNTSITLTIGSTTLKLESGQTTLTTPKVITDSPDATNTGTLKVQGLLTYLAGLAGSGGSGASATITGSISVVSGDVSADGHTLKGHHHTEHDGPSTSAPIG